MHVLGDVAMLLMQFHTLFIIFGLTYYLDAPQFLPTLLLLLWARGASSTSQGILSLFSFPNQHIIRKTNREFAVSFIVPAPEVLNRGGTQRNVHNRMYINRQECLLKLLNIPSC